MWVGRSIAFARRAKGASRRGWAIFICKDLARPPPHNLQARRCHVRAARPGPGEAPRRAALAQASFARLQGFEAACFRFAARTRMLRTRRACDCVRRVPRTPLQGEGPLQDLPHRSGRDGPDGDRQRGAPEPVRGVRGDEQAASRRCFLTRGNFLTCVEAWE